MKRRDVLTLLGASGALAAGVWFGLAGGGGALLGRARRAPSDVLARMRQRTRPLDPQQLSAEHDLAG